MRFVLKRLALFVVALFGLSVVVFAALRILPGDVASVMAGVNSPPERVTQLREQLGLNRPLIAQYFDWMSALARGDFGTSILTGRSVTSLVGARASITFPLIILALLIALVIGLPLGVLLVAGDKDGVLPLPGWLMHLLNIVINILRSVPFLILMICVFPLSRAIVGTTVGTKATIVPLVVAAFPFVARLVETSLRELDEGVVEAAQSMGATPFQIITKVMIPECLPGLISSMTTALTTILGYSAMSGAIGGGGLGKVAISYGYYRYQTNIMIVCVVLLILLVQAFQSVGTFWANQSDKRLRK